MFETDPGMHPFVKYMRGVIDTQKTHNLVDIRSMIAAKNLASMFKRFSHTVYSEREYSWFLLNQYLFELIDLIWYKMILNKRILNE